MLRYLITKILATESYQIFLKSFAKPLFLLSAINIFSEVLNESAKVVASFGPVKYIFNHNE